MIKCHEDLIPGRGDELGAIGAGRWLVLSPSQDEDMSWLPLVLVGGW